MEILTHTARLWRWTGGNAPASWFFATIAGSAGQSLAEAALMRRLELGKPRGFGALKVAVTIGDTCWQTSVFPSKEAGGYLLPVKAAVRKAEGLGEGDDVEIRIALL